jgi:predicted Zn-dependent protease
MVHMIYFLNYLVRPGVLFHSKFETVAEWAEAMHLGIYANATLVEVTIEHNKKPHAHGAKPRARGTNPRALGTNPRANKLRSHLLKLLERGTSGIEGEDS